MIFSSNNSSSFSLKREAPFALLILALGALAFFIAPFPQAAMWFGFAVAGYSAIANDSIQTLGTFLTSNQKLPWWLLWIFIGGILVATLTYGWYTQSGDIANGRLEKIDQPLNFTPLMLLAPVILLVLTRLSMPVSTTFLLLSVFSSTVVIQSMLIKTLQGYVIAFVVALLVWAVVAYVYKKEYISNDYNKQLWRVLQAGSTGFLWWTWITHDTANVAVFLPRTLSAWQMVGAVTFLFAVVGIVMYFRGGRIQSVVNEKTDIIDVRAATFIDFVYALILVYFKQLNSIPMSTTWVFLGLLAGREIALTLISAKAEPYKTTAKLVLKDIFRAGMGLLISLIIVVFLVA